MGFTYSNKCTFCNWTDILRCDGSSTVCIFDPEGISVLTFLVQGYMHLSCVNQNSDACESYCGCEGYKLAATMCNCWTICLLTFSAGTVHCKARIE